MTARYVGTRSLRLVEKTRDARSPRSRLRRAACVLAATAALTIVLAAPASATTETFNFTGAAQTWTVPSGVIEATFDLHGAQGRPTFGVGDPGLGGRATATIAVSSGASIQVNVGGQPTSAAGGFNGGGSGVVSGGGGASDIRTGAFGLADRVLVAGGGGGDGGCGTGGLATNGGGGGGLVGGDALNPTGGFRRLRAGRWGRNADHRWQRHVPGDARYVRRRW